MSAAVGEALVARCLAWLESRDTLDTGLFADEDTARALASFVAPEHALLVETLGWLKSYGFENKPHQFNGLIGRIERQVGTGWEARGATPPEPPSMTAPRER